MKITGEGPASAGAALAQKRFLLLFASALKALLIYPPGHPGIEQTMVAFYRSLLQRLAGDPQLSLVFLKDEVAVDNIPERGLSGDLRKLAASLSAAGTNRITFQTGLTFEEVGRLVAFLHEKSKGAAAQRPRLPHIQIEQVVREEGLLEGDLGLGRAAASFYDSAMLSLKDILTSGETFGAAHLRLARDIVGGILVSLDSDPRLVESLYFLRQHDDYTLTHAINVCGLAVGQARALGLPEQLTVAVGIGALLHDLGKRGVPPEILTKQGKLSSEEFEVIKRHPLLGARSLCTMANLPDLVPLIAAEHHLRFDAKGYPERRRPRPPNLGSQLVQLADVYDALRTDRPYRRGKSLQETLAIMIKGAGTEFHPLLLKRFGLLIVRQAERLGRVAEVDLALVAADVPVGQSLRGDQGSGESPKTSRIITPGR
jgi:HD-GYP domain-containing protein (c-di-GMP phosphodiesterase class II)